MGKTPHRLSSGCRQIGPTRRSGRARFRVICRYFRSAPGRIRTCDRRIRSPLLCPLSYGRIRLIYVGFSASGSSQKPRCQQYVSSSPSESLVHRVGQPAVHALDNVAIGVERDGDRCMSEQFLDKLGVLACHEEYCSAGAAEIVESDLGQFRFLQEGLEVATEEVGAARGGARESREDEDFVEPRGAQATPQPPFFREHAALQLRLELLVAFDRPQPLKEL